MALILQKEIATETIIGLWRIEEKAEWFLSQLQLNESEMATINSIRHPQRKLHWLSSRVLLRALMETGQFIHLENDMHGKPVVRNFPVEVSISHSAHLSAILLSRKYKVGIDIEKMDPKVLRIQHKFVNEEEMNWVGDDNRIEKLYAIWCAKEAMYKLYGEKKLDFRQHLLLEPFDFAGAGMIYGRIAKEDYTAALCVQYEMLGEYMTACVMQ